MTALKQVTQFLARQLNIDEGKIQPDSTFESLGIDSLDTVELLIDFEEEFATELEMSGSLKTVADFVKLIEAGPAHD